MHPLYGLEIQFFDDGYLDLGDSVQLHDYKALTVVLNTDPLKFLGYIQSRITASRVDVILTGSDKVLNSVKGTYNVSTGTGGFGSSTGTGGSGGAVPTVFPTSIPEPNSGLEDTLPDGWTFKPSQWSCKCPYCPERLAIKAPKAPTCYTCGDKMDPA